MAFKEVYVLIREIGIKDFYYSGIGRKRWSENRSDAFRFMRYKQAKQKKVELSKFNYKTKILICGFEE